MKKIWILAPVLLCGLLSNCSFFDSAPESWKKWRQSAQERHDEKFSAPSITHHIYLNHSGDSVWIDPSPPYPRFTKHNCDQCKWRVIRRGDNRVAFGLSKSNLTEVSLEKEIPLDESLFVSGHFYEEDKSMRLFIHDLSQKNLSEKRKRSFFRYDPKMKIQARIQWLSQPEERTIQRSDGSQKKIPKFADLIFELNGKRQSLSLYSFSGDEKGLASKTTMFLFRDPSNGKETYGAGRFLNVEFDSTIKDLKKDEVVWLDFNFSYNPPCAVSTGFHCPLPQDLLKTEVLAGERYVKH